MLIVVKTIVEILIIIKSNANFEYLYHFVKALFVYLMMTNHTGFILKYINC